MRREFHVRFCEGPGVQFHRATRLVIIFESKEDAERVYEVLPKRFARYGLRLHPEKTRLFHCRPTPDHRGGPRGPGAPTFDFLGFTHYWAKSRRGRWFLSRKTMRKRFARTMRRFWEWCRDNRHADLEYQQKSLSRKLMGHYAYFGITGNFPALAQLHHRVGCIWRFLVGETVPAWGDHVGRLQRAEDAVSLGQAPYCALLRRPVANLRHEEPDARIAHVRICGSREAATPPGHPTAGPAK